MSMKNFAQTKGARVLVARTFLRTPLSPSKFNVKVNPLMLIDACHFFLLNKLCKDGLPIRLLIGCHTALYTAVRSMKAINKRSMA